MYYHVGAKASFFFFVFSFVKYNLTILFTSAITVSNYHRDISHLTLFKDVFIGTFNHRSVATVIGLVFAGVKHAALRAIKRDIKTQCHFLRLTVFCFAVSRFLFFFFFFPSHDCEQRDF